VVAWLESEGQTIIAVTNAGIFEPGLIPTGLYVESSIELHPVNLEDGYGNFYLKPNGVFYVSNHQLGILESSRFLEEGLEVEYALQSGPLLIQQQEIHPAFTQIMLCIWMERSANLLRKNVQWFPKNPSRLFWRSP